MSGDMSSFVSALTAGITADSLWTSITPLASLMITIFLFAFAYYVYKRLTRNGSHGKFKS